MPARLTNKLALSTQCEGDSRAKYVYDDSSPLGLRVTASGARTWFAEVWLRPSITGEKGRSVRRSIASVSEMSADAARSAAIKIAGELVNGKDALEDVRQERQQAKQEALSLEAAVKAYTKGKRRGKDGLGLKERTAYDYLQMVEPGGLLHGLASCSIYRIAADDIRACYDKIAQRSEHSAAAAMRTLRAVLNWHGVVVEDSPFAKTTAGRDRIVLKSSTGNPTPIPPEKLRAWWAAAMARRGDVSADGLRFMLLTGCRPGEVFGSRFSSGLLAGDVDLQGGRVQLRDTKNRSDHVVLLSRQALEIVSAHCEGKEPEHKVFDVLDPGKTLQAINQAAEVSAAVSAHKLRHTFCSVAEELVTTHVLKRMVNHAGAGDVTGMHYVGKSEAQLRAGWQAVADFIAPQSNVVPLKARAAK